MKLIIAFIAGVLVGGLVAAILLRPVPTAERRDDAYWQERAESAERELASARRQLETLTGDLQRLTERFNGLAGRFEALQGAAAAPTPANAP